MFKYLLLNSPVYFRLTTAGRTIIGSKLIEFVHEKMVQINLIKKNSEGYVISYQLEAQHIEGTAIIHQWAADMEAFQSPLFFLVNHDYELVNILNQQELYDKWPGYFKNLLPKYQEQKEVANQMAALTAELLKDKQRLLTSYLGYSAWRFFFSKPYSDKEQPENDLLLKGYFGEIDLQLKIVAEWKQTPSRFNKRYELQNKATLDKEKFNRKSFARILKNLTGMYDISAELTAELEETFTYEDQTGLTEAEMFLETNVNEWYKVTSAHQLQQLSGNEIDDYKQLLTEKSTLLA